MSSPRRSYKKSPRSCARRALTTSPQRFTLSRVLKTHRGCLEESIRISFPGRVDSEKRSTCLTTLVRHSEKFPTMVPRELIPSATTWTCPTQGSLISQILPLPGNGATPEGKRMQPPERLVAWLLRPDATLSSILRYVDREPTTRSLQLRCTAHASNGCADAMSAILYRFTCADCCAKFIASGVPELSYGQFVLRTETGVEMYLDALTSDVFHEVRTLVHNHPLLAATDDRKTADVVHGVFGCACDRARDDRRLHIVMWPTCPACSSRNMKSWLSVYPPRS